MLNKVTFSSSAKNQNAYFFELWLARCGLQLLVDRDAHAGACQGQNAQNDMTTTTKVTQNDLDFKG